MLFRFIAMAVEATKAVVRKLPSHLTLDTFCNTLAGVTAVAIIAGKTASPVIDYMTDTALGFCCAHALLAQDGAIARKVMLFLLWEAYRALQWYMHRQASSITILSNDLNPIVRNVCIILPFCIVLAVLFLRRLRKPAAAAKPDVDLEAQRAAVAEEIADAERARMAQEALNSVGENDDDGAGPSTMMEVNPLHLTPDDSFLPPALPMPVVTPAPRTRIVRQPFRGTPFGITMDWSRIESA